MQERRVLPKEFGDYLVRGIVMIAVVAALLFLLPWTWERASGGIFPGYSIFIVLACLPGISYWSVRYLAAVAKLVTPGRVLYEGRAHEGGKFAVPAIALMFLFFSVFGPISVLGGGQSRFTVDDFYFFFLEGVFLAFIIIVFIRIRQTRLAVEDGGLVLRRWSLLPRVPPRFIPFEELEYLVLEKRILAYRTKYRYVRGRLVVQDPEMLDAVLRKTYTAGKRAIKRR